MRLRLLELPHVIINATEKKLYVGLHEKDFLLFGGFHSLSKHIKRLFLSIIGKISICDRHLVLNDLTRLVVVFERIVKGLFSEFDSLPYLCLLKITFKCFCLIDIHIGQVLLVSGHIQIIHVAFHFTKHVDTLVVHLFRHVKLVHRSVDGGNIVCGITDVLLVERVRFLLVKQGHGGIALVVAFDSFIHLSQTLVCHTQKVVASSGIEEVATFFVTIDGYFGVVDDFCHFATVKMPENKLLQYGFVHLFNTNIFGETNRVASHDCNLVSHVNRLLSLAGQEYIVETINFACMQRGVCKQKQNHKRKTTHNNPYFGTKRSLFCSPKAIASNKHKKTRNFTYSQAIFLLYFCPNG